MEPFRVSDGRLFLLDQTALPAQERWIEIEDARGMADAIAKLRVRGAPAIGIAAALALWVEAERIEERDPYGARGARLERLREAGETLVRSRPTAANLAWAVSRVLRAAELSSPRREDGGLAGAVRAESLAIWEEDRTASRAMARLGASLFPREKRFLTHCHTGGLATGGGGTALGVLLELHRAGREISVWATETRPLLQGSRLTAWELERENIPVTLLADGAAAFVIRRASIEGVVVGADRIARNGDTANKVGTLPIALAARERGIPFVVVAPTSTVDPSCPDGDAIPIEERPQAEVLGYQELRVAPEGARAVNPAFDVTPSKLITAIVTERDVHRGPGFWFADVDTVSKYR